MTPVPMTAARQRVDPVKPPGDATVVTAGPLLARALGLLQALKIPLLVQLGLLVGPLLVVEVLVMVLQSARGAINLIVTDGTE